MGREVLATIFKPLHFLAISTDRTGPYLSEVHAMGMQLYAVGTTVSHAYAHFESAGHGVSIGGLVVRPGDLLHADRHGILLIPAEVADKVPAAADEIIASEQKLIGWVRSKDFDPRQLDERRKVPH